MMNDADRKAFEDWFNKEYFEPYQMEKDAAKDAWQAALNLRDKQAGKPLSERESAVLNFALHQFLSNAYLHMNAAAQDKEHRRYPLDAVDKFHEDAKTTELLLSKFQHDCTAPPKNCRQRQKMEGKGYPRSSCQVCGHFSPKWKECEFALQAEREQK